MQKCKKLTPNESSIKSIYMIIQATTTLSEARNVSKNYANQLQS